MSKPRPRPGNPNLLLIAGLAVVLVIIALSVNAFLGGAVGTGFSSQDPAAAGADSLPAEVDVIGAAALRDAGAFVLDVREPWEWEQGHIPGATLIPLAGLARRVAEVPADRDVVVVCRSGNRSREGRDILRAAGRAGVTSMNGGIVDWIGAGLPVETGP
jgi:rhodanese-related sulfurtransferase